VNHCVQVRLPQRQTSNCLAYPFASCRLLARQQAQDSSCYAGGLFAYERYKTSSG
jgi:hypothetical protein